MQQALHSSMVKHLLPLLACNLLSMLRAQRAARARDGRGHTPQLPPDTRRNFEIRRQPQKPSKEQSSGTRQKHSKHFPQKKTTERDKRDFMRRLLILVKFYQASSFFWTANWKFGKYMNSWGSQECLDDFEIFPFCNAIKLLLIHLNTITGE